MQPIVMYYWLQTYEGLEQTLCAPRATSKTPHLKSLDGFHVCLPGYGGAYAPAKTFMASKGYFCRPCVSDLYSWLEHGNRDQQTQGRTYPPPSTSIGMPASAHKGITSADNKNVEA